MAEHQKIPMMFRIQFQNRPLIPTPIAVIWRREYSHNFLIMEDIVASHTDFMGSRYTFYFVCVGEFLRDVLAESVADSPAGIRIESLLITGVRP